MSNKTVSSVVETMAEPESKSKTTFTKWDTFDKAGLKPVQIVCSSLPMHPADEACKTAFIPTGTNVITHIKAEHGGGFIFTVREATPRLKRTDPSPWNGWDELQASGAELQSFRCEVCDRQVNLSVRDIRAHLKPHQGKFRGAYQAFKNTFLLNIQFTPPPAAGDDLDESYE